MRYIKGQRHVIFRLTSSISKHHPLITSSLLFFCISVYSLAYILRLLMNQRDNPTRITTELISSFGIPNCVNNISSNGLNIEISSTFHLTRQDDLPSGNKGFTCNLTLWIKS